MEWTIVRARVPDFQPVYFDVGAVVAGYGSEEAFVLTVEDGHVTTLKQRPDWARAYWLDVEGRKLRVEGTAGVMLPAWSPDARQVAFLRHEGNAYVVYVVRLSVR